MLISFPNQETIRVPRALVKYLDNISDEDILGLNIPTGTPLVYELGDDFKAISHRYLGDQSAIEAKMKAVANQGAQKGELKK